MRAGAAGFAGVDESEGAHGENDDDKRHCDQQQRQHPRTARVIVPQRAARQKLLCALVVEVDRVYHEEDADGRNDRARDLQQQRRQQRSLHKMRNLTRIVAVLWT